MPYKDKEKEKEAKKRYEEKRKAVYGQRHRVWTGIGYPDSMPEDWEEQVSSLHMKVWFSPLHNKDKWTKADEKKNKAHKAGNNKKDHFHYIAEYEVPVDMATFLSDFSFLNGPTNIEAVKSLRSMVRYLAHLDDPQKAPYNKEEIRVFGGAELDIVEQLGSHERHEQLRAMRRFIKDNQIVDYCEFVDYCDECESSWASLLDDNSSYTIEKYIKSRRYKVMEERRMLAEKASRVIPKATADNLKALEEMHEQHKPEVTEEKPKEDEFFCFWKHEEEQGGNENGKVD